MAYITDYWCEELEDSPTEEGSNESGGSFSATVKLKVNWEDRMAILTEIIGNFQLYPRNPSSGARAVSGSSKPFKGATGNEGGDTGWAAYQFAELTIKYSLKAETSDLISESLDPTAEFVTQDYKKFQWKANGGFAAQALTEHEAPGRIQRGLEYGITFYKCTNIPSWIIDPTNTLIDKVNAAAVTSQLLGLTFQPGTLLFNPPKMSRKWNFTSYPYWQVELKMTHRPQGWNKFWCGAIGDYNTMQGYGPGGTKAAPNWQDYQLYQSGDFSQIWSLSN